MESLRCMPAASCIDVAAMRAAVVGGGGLGDLAWVEPCQA